MRSSPWKKVLGLVFLASVSQGVGALAGDETAPDPMLIQRCNACHYIDGKPTAEEFPRIAGQHELYLRKAMLKFKTVQRHSEVMAAISSLNNDEELLRLASYYAKQPPAAEPARPNPDPALVAKGQQAFTTERVYSIACVDCHGPDAKGYVRKTPRTRGARAIPSLAGQQPVYLKAMLSKYTGAGSGKPPQAGMCGMRKAGKTLSVADVDALVEFLSSR